LICGNNTDRKKVLYAAENSLVGFDGIIVPLPVAGDFRLWAIES
jgi:hypothetical protein